MPQGKNVNSFFFYNANNNAKVLIIFLIIYLSSPSATRSPGVPGPPGVLRVEEIRDSSIKLAWSKGGDHNSPILYYTIQTRHFWALNEDDWRVATTCEY